MYLLLQLAWLCVMSLWLSAYGDELMRGLMGALLPWFVLLGSIVAGALLLLGYGVVTLCVRSKRATMG